MKKTVLSLSLALVMCLSLALPAFAANQKIYFKLTETTENGKRSISFVETDSLGPSDETIPYGIYSSGPYSISGTDLRQTGTVVYPEFGETAYQFTVPVYTASAPVTVTMEVGAERGVPIDWPQVGWAQVDLVSYDAANKTYEVLKEHTLFFDGYYSFENQSGKIEDISIKEYYTTDNVWDRMASQYGICRSAAATLSAPGTYRIEADYRGLEGTYEVFVTITEGASDTPAPTAPSFTDVVANAWYSEAVTWAVENEITNGTGNGTTFSPLRDCTHAQILTFLYRAARNEGAATSDDMNKAITWAREKGMIDSSFDGNKLCTRADAVNYIWQAFNKPSAKASSFNDVPVNADYAAAVNWAVANGVTEGTGNRNFSPNKVCNRGTIVTFLYRAMEP